MSLNGYDPCIHWSNQFAHRDMWVYNKESLSFSKWGVCSKMWFSKSLAEAMNEIRK